MSGTLAKEYGEQGKHPVGSEAWGAKIRRHAQKLVNELESGYMDLAELLYIVYDTPVNGDRNNMAIYRSWGYDTWEDWIAHELPAVVPQKAQSLRRIHFILNVTLADLPDTVRRRIVALGFSKVREIVKVLTASNAEHWAEIAEKMNVAEVIEHVRDAKKKAEALAQAQALSGEEGDPDFMPSAEEAKELRNKNFKLYTDQSDIVEHAIKRASELSKNNKSSYNLTLICTDFLANNDFRLPNDPKLQARYVAKLEQLLGKKLLMVDPVTREVEYGVDVIRVLAEAAAASEPK